MPGNRNLCLTMPEIDARKLAYLALSVGTVAIVLRAIASAPAAVPEAHVAQRGSWHCQEIAGQTSLPPMLWTLPGSGNTWLRLILEHATGLCTGSVYNDTKLKPILHSESRCDRSVVAVKIHVNEWPVDTIARPVKHCTGVFEGSLNMVRHPLHAIWAEYQRQNTGACHVCGIKRANFESCHVRPLIQ